MGNITSVSQNVSGLSNGTAITNSYSYDSGDRLSRITHNGFNYNFGYTEFGLLESIKLGSRSLINYGYDSKGVLNSASYGNGQTIDYDYNEDGKSTAVMQDGNLLYSYDYDEYGTLMFVNDNVSNRFTNYLTNEDGQDIIEETGAIIYHKYYQTENKKVETIEDRTKTTETILDDYSTKTKYKVDYDYDSTHEKNTDKFGRTSNEGVYITSKNSTYEVCNKEYSYESPSSGQTSERVSQITYMGGYDKTIEYKYDECGNISEINGIGYEYDEAGQLTSEINEIGRISKKYVYDKGGNITQLNRYENGKLVQMNTYTYGNSSWKDLLTAYNGNKITYDEIGNPLTYYNGTEFSWTMGRRLESVKNDIGNISYTYNADGLRTSKKINGMRFNYFWNGDKLTAQTWNRNLLYFYYDNDGNPIGFDYNDEHYYYLTNLQGDIIAIIDHGITVAEYKYDAWGNCTILYDTNDIADINPLRYRGYYYDYDTNLYYLQSRYYDANIGRFINADDVEILTENDKIVLENNIFSFCYNDPVSYDDHDGQKAKKVAKLKKVNKKNVKINVIYKYDRQKALEYMKKWYNKKNPNFIDGGFRGDCANFVSQCMNAGGISMNNKWKCKVKDKNKALASRLLRVSWSTGYDYTSNWSFAPDHYDYFRKSYLDNGTYNIYNVEQVNNSLKNWDVKVGDLVYYFEKGATKPHHVAIVSRKGSKVPLEVAQHTNSYLYRDVREQLKKEYRILIIRIKDVILPWNQQ